MANPLLRHTPPARRIAHRSDTPRAHLDRRGDRGSHLPEGSARLRKSLHTDVPEDRSSFHRDTSSIQGAGRHPEHRRCDPLDTRTPLLPRRHKGASPLPRRESVRRRRCTALRQHTSPATVGRRPDRVSGLLVCNAVPRPSSHIVGPRRTCPPTPRYHLYRGSVLPRCRWPSRRLGRTLLPLSRSDRRRAKTRGAHSRSRGHNVRRSDKGGSLRRQACRQCAPEADNGRCLRDRRSASQPGRLLLPSHSAGRPAERSGRHPRSVHLHHRTWAIPEDLDMPSSLGPCTESPAPSQGRSLRARTWPGSRRPAHTARARSRCSQGRQAAFCRRSRVRIRVHRTPSRPQGHNLPGHTTTRTDRSECTPRSH